MVRILCSLIVLLLLAQPLSAQWEISVKNLLRDSYNTLVYLKYTGQGLRNRTVNLSVGFQRQKQFGFVLHKELQVDISSGEVYPLRFKVPQDDYVVKVDIKDTQTQTHTYLEEEFSATVSRDRFAVSDIFLSYNENIDTALLEPILRPTVQPGGKALLFSGSLR